MVAPAHAQGPRPAWLACKMVIYATSFLAFILAAVPYGSHRLGNYLYPDSVHAFLTPGTAQKAVGAVLFCGALSGYLGCSLWLVIKGRGPFVEFDPPRRFVADGPFRWTRNPIASLLLLAILAEGIFFGSAGMLSLFVLGLPLAQLQVTRIEEPRLRTRFGQAYLDYCRRVPRWLPRRPRGDTPPSA